LKFKYICYTLKKISILHTDLIKKHLMLRNPFEPVLIDFGKVEINEKEGIVD